MSPRDRRTRRRVAWIALLASATAACTGGSAGAPPTTAAPTTTVAPVPEERDGRLTIGLLLPTSDPVLGEDLAAAADDAVDRINDAGGVLGQNVRVVLQDENADEGSAADGIAALLDPSVEVDAVVGPTSSLAALSDLDALVAAGVATCSPTATALALDDFPDDRLFFRTVPSDSLQAVAIADLAERTGVQQIAIAHVDDAYGRPFADAVAGALDAETRPADAVQLFPFSRDGQLDSVANDVAESDAGVVVVIANADDGTAFLEALDDTNFGSIDDIVVNDALRSPAVAQRIEALDPAVRDLIRGVAPEAQSNDPDRPYDPPGVFAAHAFDCVTLIALAAASVRSDDPGEFASQIPALTISGRVCRSYESCVELLDDGLNINYNGPDGITELLVMGDPARARFDVFRFDDTGRATFDQSIEATSR